jgi:hypothetical protein
MLISVKLGQLAGDLYKEAAKTQRARAGRLHKGDNMAKQLDAAGSTKYTKGVFSYPKGKSV